MTLLNEPRSQQKAHTLNEATFHSFNKLGLRKRITDTVVGQVRLLRIAMSSLNVHSVHSKGNLQEESLWIQVTEDIENLSYYLVCDTTYTDENHISNELRHLFWFPKKSAKKGDWIQLATRNGKSTTLENDQGTTTHVFYWNLGRTVWNKAGDAALLFDLRTWKATKV